MEGGRGGEGSHLLRRYPEDPVRLTPKGKRVGIASAWVCLFGCLSPKSFSMGPVGSAEPNARNGPAMLRVRVRVASDVSEQTESRYQQTATEGGPVLLLLPCFRSLPSAVPAAATQGIASFPSTPRRGRVWKQLWQTPAAPVSCSPAVPWASHSVKQTSQRSNLGCGRCSPPTRVILPVLPRVKRRGGEVQARLAVMPIIEQHRAPLLCPSRPTTAAHDSILPDQLP